MPIDYTQLKIHLWSAADELREQRGQRPNQE
jgi:hypothetical protein